VRVEANPDTTRRKTWRRYIVPVIAILFSVGLSVALFLLARAYPDQINRFGSYGYLGVFIVSIISSATVILPVPGVFVLLPVVVTLNPVLVALAASTGGIIGEITGYVAGYGGQAMVNKGKYYQRI